MSTEAITRPPSPSTGRFAWGAATTAGVVASIVFQLLEILLIPRFGGDSPWGPARMIAAMVRGRGVLPPPATFDLGIVLTALVVDIVLAVIYAVVLGFIIRSWSLGRSLLVAAIFGLILYGLNFYVFTGLFPWFVMGRNGVTIVTHIVFSLTAALVFKRLQGHSAR